MREVIQQVLTSEQKAKSIVDAARSEADHLLTDAQKESQALLARAREQAQREARTILDAALRAAEQAKAQRLSQLAAEVSAHVRLDPSTRDSAVEAAVRCVCGQSPGADKNESSP